MSEELIYCAKRLGIFLVMVALIVGMVGCWGASTPSKTFTPIKDWYELDAIRDNLGGYYTLMNNLTKATEGYDELAGPTANGGKGWEPIGSEFNPFKGWFDGQGYNVTDLVINRPNQNHVGLFGYSKGYIEDISVLNVAVTGKEFVGSLVGRSDGEVYDSHSAGSVTGERVVGGLVGWNFYLKKDGGVHYSDSTCSVTGKEDVGGLVGVNDGGQVNDSHSNSSVTGTGDYSGGLTGRNQGIVRNSYSTGSVTSNDYVGGLVGDNDMGKVYDSHSTSSVTGNKVVGGLVGWNAHGLVSDSFAFGDVTGREKVGNLVGWESGGYVSESSKGTGNVTVIGND